MKNVTKTICLNYKDSQFLNKILNNEPTCEEECFGKDSTFHITVPFSGDIKIDIKCYGVQYNEEDSTNLPWTEATLYSSNMARWVSDPSDDFFGEWQLECRGVRYTVFVKPSTDPSITENVIIGDELVTYDVVLCEKQCDDGLDISEVCKMYNMLHDSYGCPIELDAKEHESCAMGFITPDASSSLTINQWAELSDMIASILDDMDKENESHEYKYKDLCIYLSRNF